PCIYRDMGRCLAPCAGGVSAEEYRAGVACAEWVLDGNIAGTRAMLEASMLEASEAVEFERAAALRDSIRALTALKEKQKVVADSKVNRDVFAIYKGEAESILAVLSVRGGALINKNELTISDDGASEEELISLIASYYDTGIDAPSEIMLDFELDGENTALLSEYLSLGKKYKVRIKFPERGDGRALCDLALANGKEAERQRRLTERRENKNLTRIKELLALAEIPERIEAYDISNIGKEHITASMVVSVGGVQKRAEYRSFNIKSVSDAPDDYASMREVIRRRLLHIGDGSESLGKAPDLILVDGGATHVRAAREVAAELSCDVAIFGMVKDDFHKTRALTDGENDISIALDTAVYSFVYNLQEEAHRFAVKCSSGAKRKTLTRSSLENIKGIGASKAKKLLSAMSLSEIRVAGESELSAIPGISKSDAAAIRAYYREREKKGKGSKL
ncbi:MAG: UvrB/UvrC motif-containing protein, partial [Clostridia bacterium]|nr:UvrB/UvrC motif-containing protein [Clostridia bacterium]